MTAPARGAPYARLRIATPDDTTAILALCRAVYGDQVTDLDLAYWQWRFLDESPFRGEVMLAEREGRVIGIQPLAIFDWLEGAERLRGGMYSGVMTHPDHRRRGVFSDLIQACDDHATRAGARFCFTLPNDASMAGFRKLGGWQAPGPIPMYLKVVDGRALVASRAGQAVGSLLGRAAQIPFARVPGRPHRGRIEAVDQVPAELDEVADAFAADAGTLMIRRGAAYWDWRYSRHPHRTYRTLVLRRGGELVGAVAVGQGERMGLPVGMVVDLVARGGRPTLRALLRAAADETRTRGLGLLACQATTPRLRSALRREGFRSPPPGLMGKRFHFVYRIHDLPGADRVPAALAGWHLTLGDSDNA